MRAVFGDVDHVAPIAERIAAISEGNPRWTMALCERLVERGLARYEAGSFMLPPELAAGDLPDSLAAALSARIAALPEGARELAQALALTDSSALSLERLPLLTAHGDRGSTFRALDELLASGVLVQAGERYRFAQRELVDLLVTGISSEHERGLHARIARAALDCGRPALVPHHLLLSRQEAPALEALIALRTDTDTAEVSAFTLALYEQGLHAVERIGMPLRVRLELHSTVVAYAALLSKHATFVRHATPLLARLERDSGLCDYRELGDDMPAEARLTLALTRAQQRWEATPEHERGYPLLEAIRMLARTTAAAMSLASVAQDLEMLERLPSLTPLAPLSPALAVTQRMIDAALLFHQGRLDDAFAGYAWVLERVEQPDGAGLEPVFLKPLRLGMKYILAVMEAAWGVPNAAKRVEELKADPGYRVAAWRVHMASELMQGHADVARECQRRAELLRLEDGEQMRYGGTTVRIELLALMRAADVVGVKRCAERIERVAAEFPLWLPDLHYARFHYRRLQGDHAGAYEAIAAALPLVAAGRNVNWARVTSAHVTALNHLGRHAEAAAHGIAYLDAAARAGFAAAPRELMLALIEPLVATGELERAQQLAQECIAAYEQVGSRGLMLGTCHELAARVAAARRDAPAFAEHAERCAQEWRRGRSDVLVAQHAQLVHDVEQLGVAIPTALRGAAEPSTVMRYAPLEHDARNTYAKLAVFTDPAERAREALDLLLQSHGADAGYLYAQGNDAPNLLASANASDPPQALIQNVARLLCGHPKDDDTATVFETAAVTRAAEYGWSDSEGRRFTPVLLASRRDGRTVVIAVAVLHTAEYDRPAPSSALHAAIADALGGG